MDYREWGMEYLALAQRLREHTLPLRGELGRAAGEEKILLYRRVAMLDEMHLECLHTGKLLVKKGERFREREIKSQS